MSVRYLVTTTHRSNPRVRSLAKELARSLPRAVRVNRGKMSLAEVVERAKSLGASRVVIVGRGLRGNPGRVEILEGLNPPFVSLVLKLRGVKLARELGVRPTPPLSAAVVAQPVPAAVEFAHELAAAMDLSILEGVRPEDLADSYDSVLLVEHVGRGGAAFALWFLDPRTGGPRGPRLLVERYAVIARGAVRGNGQP